MTNREHTLWYKQPAKNFTQALPLGNGHMGAMVYGDYPNERISLNLDTLWSGYPGHWKGKQTVTEGTLNDVRKLIHKREYNAAQNVIKEKMLGCNNESYLSAGRLALKYTGIEGEISCVRQLKLDEAKAESSWKGNGQEITEEVFISSAQNGMYIRICTNDTPLNLTAELYTELREIGSEYMENKYLLMARAPTHVEPNYVESNHPIQYDESNPGMMYGILLCVCETDGVVYQAEQGISVKGFTNLVMGVYGETGYKGYGRVLCESDAIISALHEMRKQCDGKTYEDLYSKHLSEHQKLYLRTELEIDEVDSVNFLPTDRRLELLKNGSEDLGLAVLLFHYGRYLMISSSRPLDHLVQPANLQGIWCEDVRSVWSSNWTVNINTEMNYWVCGSANLLECEIPLIGLLEDLAKSGEEAARNLGCRGFAVHHNVDLWRQSIPALGEVKWAFWPMGGLWLVTHLYNHYTYTGDLAYLKRIYPIFVKCVYFIMDYIQQDENGIYQTSPATSPENTFYYHSKEECAVCTSPTMDIVLIREVLTNMLDILNVLERVEIEPGFYRRIKEILSHLPEFKIGKKGQLLEWQEEYEETDPKHRHLAHLIGFHPFHQIQIENNIELADAVKKSLELRLEDKAQYIGWNCAWLVNFFARFRDTEKAYGYVKQILKYSVYDNLFDLHPPLGENAGEREIFQIDGNFGVAAGITEFLIQWNNHSFELLPALPDSWKSGRIKGLMAPGAVELYLEWKDMQLIDLKLLARKDGKHCIVYNSYFGIADRKQNIYVSSLSENSKWEMNVFLKAGEKYSLI